MRLDRAAATLRAAMVEAGISELTIRADVLPVTEGEEPLRALVLRAMEEGPTTVPDMEARVQELRGRATASGAVRPPFYDLAKRGLVGKTGIKVRAKTTGHLCSVWELTNNHANESK